MKALVRCGLVVAISGLLGASPALGVSVSFLPATQNAGVGESVSVDLVVSGLAAGSAPSVGAFDLDVTFDPLVLAASSVTFGSFLGDEAQAQVLTSSALASGLVDLAAVSFLLPDELDALQPASFALATLFFSTLAAGTSPLTLSQVFVDDALGARLAVDTVGGSVSVSRAVPGPATLGLVGVGLLAWTLRGRRVRRGRYLPPRSISTLP
jgi:hypothetical protein